MTLEFNEKHFQSWLLTNQKISNKGARDVVSRLKRSLRIVSSLGHENISSYEMALKAQFENSDIPISSQASMLRSVRLFYFYKR